MNPLSSISCSNRGLNGKSVLYRLQAGLQAMHCENGLNVKNASDLIPRQSLSNFCANLISGSAKPILWG